MNAAGLFFGYFSFLSVEWHFKKKLKIFIMCFEGNLWKCILSFPVRFSLMLSKRKGVKDFSLKLSYLGINNNMANALILPYAKCVSRRNQCENIFIFQPIFDINFWNVYLRNKIALWTWWWMIRWFTFMITNIGF